MMGLAYGTQMRANVTYEGPYRIKSTAPIGSSVTSRYALSQPQQKPIKLPTIQKTGSSKPSKPSK